MFLPRDLRRYLATAASCKSLLSLGVAMTVLASGAWISGSGASPVAGVAGAADHARSAPESLALNAAASVHLRARRGGTIREVLVQAGARVRRGELLATLEDSPLKARLAAAELALQSARQRLALLREREATAGVQARLAAAAERDLAIAEIELAARQYEIEQYRIRAPFDAYVVQSSAWVGERIEAERGPPLFIVQPLTAGAPAA